MAAVKSIQTSIKTVLVNPFTMALWGLIVAGPLAIGFLLVFAGLAVVVPVLAHSAWHLYRKSWSQKRMGEAPIKKRGPYKKRSA
jgi:uncharacterized membrane protein